MSSTPTGSTFSLGSFFARVIADVKSAASHVVDFFDGFDHEVDAVAPTVEMVSGMVYPMAVPIEKAVVGIIDAIHAAVTSGNAAVQAGGVNLSLDKAAVDALMAAKDNAAAALVQVGVKLPGAPVAQPNDGGGTTPPPGGH
jgi:hypothetical protein